jgi:hypothetical protein
MALIVFSHVLQLEKRHQNAPSMAVQQRSERANKQLLDNTNQNDPAREDLTAEDRIDGVYHLVVVVTKRFCASPHISNIH